MGMSLLSGWGVRLFFSSFVRGQMGSLGTKPIEQTIGFIENFPDNYWHNHKAVSVSRQNNNYL